MNKIKFKGVPMKLLGSVDLKNKQLNISAVNQTGNLQSISELENGIKVISTFPKLNTSVCDDQTKAIAKLANKYQNVTFVSLTMDEVQTITKWCLAHGMQNIVIWSDRDHQQFSKATNLLIPKLKMLARGFIVLDQNNKVLDYFYKEEITAEPMFEQLEQSITKFVSIASNH